MTSQDSLSEETLTSKCAPKANAYGTTALTTVVLVLSLGLADVANSMMGYSMQGFPSWQLYFCQSLYVFLYFMLAKCMGTAIAGWWDMPRQHRSALMSVSAVQCASYILFSFTNVWVSADLAQVFGYMSMLLVPLLEYVFVGLAWSRRSTLSIVLVIVGLLLGMYPTLRTLFSPKKGTDPNDVAESNLASMVALNLLAVVLQSVGTVYSDFVFRSFPEINVMTLLLWTNLMVLPVFVLAVPLEMVPYLNQSRDWKSFEAVLNEQIAAFRCFVSPTAKDTLVGNATGTSDGTVCVHGPATWWVLVFVLSGVTAFWLFSVVTKQGGGFHVTVVSTLAYPISLGLFGWRGLVGSANYDVFLPAFYIPSFLAIFLGVIVKDVGKAEEDVDEPLPVCPRSISRRKGTASSLLNSALLTSRDTQWGRHSLKASGECVGPALLGQDNHSSSGVGHPQPRHFSLQADTPDVHPVSFPSRSVDQSDPQPFGLLRGASE